MISLKKLLCELIVVDLSSSHSDENRKYFLVYKSHLFLLDDTSNIRKLKSIVKQHPAIKRNSNIFKDTDINTFILDISSHADVLAGEWYPDSKGMVVWSEAEIIPLTSLNVKKTAKQLGAEKITYRYFSTHDDFLEKDYSAKQLVGGIPKNVFHGTTSLHLENILKYGLYPGEGHSKFISRGIVNPEHIFLAATLQAAMYYAENAVYSTERKYNNFAIVIELTIPDSSKLMPDFDADVSVASPSYYTHLTEPSSKTSMKAMGVSRETGKWGYKGRIPSSFIKWVYYYNFYDKAWHKSRPDIWKKLLDKYEWETLDYKLGLSNPEGNKL